MLDFYSFFVEDEVRSLEKDKDKENYLGGIHQQLGINPDVLPEKIETGPFEIEDLWFNQAVWKIIKPINLEDLFVRVQFVKSLSPNINQRVYQKTSNGKWIPYNGPITERIFLIPMDKFAEVMSRAWQMTVQNQQQPTMPGAIQ